MRLWAFAQIGLLAITSAGCTCERRPVDAGAAPPVDAGPGPGEVIASAVEDAGPGVADGGPAVSITDAGPRDAAVDGGADGGSSDAGDSGDAAAPDAGHPPPPADPRVAIRATIASLGALLEGRLPAHFDPQTLFQVDLLDATASAQRIAALRASIAEEEARLAARAAPTDAELAPEVVADGGGELTDGGPAAWDGGVEAPIVPAAVSPGDAAELELEQLLLQRDRLRLQFLTLPEAARATVFDAIRRRRRLAAEEEASQADVARAVDDQRRASEARQEALDQATASESAIERDLLSERARIEDARAELARWSAGLARRRRQVTRTSTERLELLHVIESQLEEMSPSEVDRRYEETVRALVTDRGRLDVALDEIGSDTGAPAFESGLDPSQPLYHDFAARSELEAAVATYDEARTRALEDEADFRWERVERIAEDVRAFDQLRIRLLPRMSQSRRETVLGLGPDGRAQLSREVDQIRLMLRFWGRRIWHDLPSIPGKIGELAARSSTRTDLLGLLALSIGFFVLARRRERITGWITAKLEERTDQGSAHAILRPLWSVLGPLLVSVTLLVSLYLGLALADHLFVDSMALAITRILVLDAAWIALIARLVTRVLVSRLRRRAGRADLARRILGSVRLVLGVGLAILVLLELSELLVGRGYLFGLVVDAAWVCVFPLFFFLVHRWSKDVTLAHRERYPEGFVEKHLEGRSSRLREQLLTPLAGLQLAWVGGTTAAKDLVLRFDQVRSGFAFLFRRRLEKRNSETKLVEIDLDDLPPELMEAFSSQNLDASLEIDCFPGLEPIAERVRAFEAGGSGFGVALVGERGIGKSTWLRALMRRANSNAMFAEVPNGLHDAAAVCRWISERLEIEVAETVDEIDARVVEAEPRVVMILDHCQNLVLRAIGGSAGVETLVEIVARTSPSVVWVCSFSRYTWLYLAAARQSQNLFLERVELQALSAERIAEIIEKRMEAVGLTASFRELVVDKLAGAALEDEVLRTEEEYLRLLWDYSQGNPRIAMHFWVRSLVPTDAGLSVRLFRAPELDALEELHERSRFLLAAIAVHENLTQAEAALTTGSDEREVAALLAYLEGREYVFEDDWGKWRLTTHWYRAVIRYLKRKRLLFE